VLLRFAAISVAICAFAALLAASTPSGVWLDVPFVKQEKEGCGAASIAMVMQYWQLQQGKPGAKVEPAADAVQIQRLLYTRDAHGIYAADLERYFRQNRYNTFAFRGEVADLRNHLAKGRPLIVALKPAGAGTDLHYVVVTGLDWQANVVMVNDPAQRKLLKQNQTDFERQWSAAGRWTLLALPQPDPH